MWVESQQAQGSAVPLKECPCLTEVYVLNQAATGLLPKLLGCSPGSTNKLGKRPKHLVSLILRAVDNNLEPGKSSEYEGSPAVPWLCVLG